MRSVIFARGIWFSKIEMLIVKLSWFRNVVAKMARYF